MTDISHSRSSKCIYHKVQFIRAVGLLSSPKVRMIAGILDQLVAISNARLHDYVEAVQMKSMTALSTVENAEQIRIDYGPLKLVSIIEIDDSATTAFHQFVQTTA